MLKNLIYNLRRFANEFTCDHVNSTHEWSDGEGWNILACTRCNRAVVFTESHRKTAILHSRAAELLRAADQHEQQCPICHGSGEVFETTTASIEECSLCDGWGIVNRSVGA
jgi:RecJ-like exonuclease